MLATPATPAAAAPIASTGAAGTGSSPELDRDLQRAASGAMTLVELLDRAGQWQQRGQGDAAVRLYETWCQHGPVQLRHVARYNQGTILAALGRHPEAERCYRDALALLPGFLQAHLNLGHELERAGKPVEAIAEWSRVIELTAQRRPAEESLRLHAMNNTARLLEMQKRYATAERWMRQSLAEQPDQPDVTQHYVHIRQKQCEWPVYQAFGDVTENQLLRCTSPLAMLSASDDPALQLMAAQRFVYEKLPKQLHPAPTVLHAAHAPVRGPDEKIRVGYLSGDLCLHAVGLLMPELLELHDRSRFEVWGYCWSRDDGTPQRARLVQAMDHHVRIGAMDDASAAERIARDGIDVLVDLQGLTSGARPAILGLRPAPVQVSYLGLPGTSGLPGVDWIVADRYVVPPELAPYLTEQPLYLPRCYQVSDRQREIAPMPERRTYGLPDDAFVYCSFNNNFKFTPALFTAWMRTLQQVPGSVLWLLADNEWAQENMLRQADAHGVARERLIFAPRVSPPEYLARFQLADLMLDTYPYNAGTTASDALWMGLPILTLSGRTYISRMAGSLLTHVGLPDLITTSVEEYERRAVQIGREPARAASYRRYLREHGRQSSLFDIPAFVRDLEAAFADLALAARAKRAGQTGPA